MAIVTGHHINRKMLSSFARSRSWLACLELLNFFRYGSIYGRQGQLHSLQIYSYIEKNKNGYLPPWIYAEDYKLVPITKLCGNRCIDDWRNVLSKGPIIAEGYFRNLTRNFSQKDSWDTILIIGISRRNNLCFINAATNNWYHVNRWRKTGSPFRYSYMDLDTCISLSMPEFYENSERGMGIIISPFWMHQQDFDFLNSDSYQSPQSFSLMV